MKPFFNPLIWILACLPAVGMGQSVLETYVQEGLESNEGLKIQQVHLEKSISALQEAKGLFLPAVNLNGTYTLAAGGRSIALPVGDLLNPVYATLNQLTQSESFPQIANVEEQFNPNNFYDLKVRTTLPLINAEVWYNRRIKEGLIPLEEAKMAVLKRELTRDIKTAYFSWLQAREAVAIYESAVALVKENVRVNESLAKNGMANPGLIIKANSELSRVEGELTEAENQAMNAAAYLNFLLNRPLTQPLTVDSLYFDLPEERTPAGEGLHREELDQLAAARNAQEQAARLARAYSMPKLSVFADLGSQGFNFQVTDGAPYVLAGVSLDMPLYAGGRNKEKIHQAELDLQAIEFQTSQVEEQLALQREVADNNLQAAFARYSAAQTQSEAAQRFFQDTWRRYREQQALYIELLDAQTAATQAQLQLSIARFQVWTRVAEWERAQ